MKRPGLTAQLFLAVLATAALVALAMSVSARWTFDRGFLGFLNEQAVQRMEVVLPRLSAAYAERGSWEFLRSRRDLWFGLVGVDASHATTDDPPDTPPERALITSDLLGAARRMSLLDAQRQHVVGFPLILADTVQRPILLDGRTVGWLAIAPIQRFTDEASLRLRSQQLHASLAAGALALLLAGAIAWWASVHLLAPVRSVARATHRLAAGAYDTRVEVRRHDEIGQLGQDFNQLALALQRNEQMRRDYMADLSHELRTPLAVLRGELEAMEDGVHPATPEALRALQAEVRMVAQLVDDLHELALADVGALSYRRSDLDLTQPFDHEAGLARGACATRGLTLEVERPTGPLAVLGDEGRLRQLLQNLVANALRYTEAPGRLRIALRAEGDDAVIEVDDSPPGVAAEHLPRLFERFYRVEGSRSRATGGSGLGLAICRSIVQAHGGTIAASASPLGGLRITVRLPRIRARVAAGVQEAVAR